MLALRNVLDLRDPRSWPIPTRREFNAHLAVHGIDPKAADPVAALRRAELARGKTIDERVSTKQLDELMRLSQEAARLVPKKQNLFFGFTRLIDAKFVCTPKVLQGLADRALADDPELTPAKLARMIEAGPDDGELIWSRPSTPGQLVASLIRQPLHSTATSIPLNMSNEIAQWLEGALAKIGRPLKFAMGGAAAFGANLAAVMNELAPGDLIGVDFYAWDDHSPEIANLFGPGVRMLDRDGERVSQESRVAKDGSAPRRNYIAGFPPPRAFTLKLGGEELHLDPVATGGRFVLSTPSSQTTTFGPITPEALKKIAAEHDTFFFSGLHYQTNDLAEAEIFRAQLDQIRAVRPEAQTHYEYAKAKVLENERALLEAFAGKLYSLSLNPGPELGGLMHRLFDWPKDLGDGAEKPDRMLEASELLMEKLRLKRLHLHAMAGDLLVVDGAKDPKRQVLSLLRARQFVTMKAANSTGEIRSVHGRHRDVWPVHTTFPGEFLAAEHEFADAMQARFRLSDAERDEIVHRRWYRDVETDRLYVFVPTRGMRDKHGGTVSAGDTIDLVALILGREKDGESVKPKHARRLL